MSPDELSLQIFPADVLRRAAGPVEVTADTLPQIRAVAERMIQIMNEAEGIGLAAPQVGLSWRMFVCDVPAYEDDPLPPEGVLVSTDGPVVYLNPEITEPAGRPEPLEEGCLSLPGIRGEVTRPPAVTIRATDLDGNRFEQTGEGLLARCWQHENDHLDGVLIIDKMSQTSRLRCRTALKRLRQRV